MNRVITYYDIPELNQYNETDYVTNSPLEQIRFRAYDWINNSINPTSYRYAQHYNNEDILIYHQVKKYLNE